MTSRKEEDGHHHLRLKVPGSLVFLTFLASCLLHCKNLPLDREDSERKRRERGEKEERKRREREERKRREKEKRRTKRRSGSGNSHAVLKKSQIITLFGAHTKIRFEFG
jgi:hypothetical protein